MREAAARLPKGSWITRGDWGAYEQWGAGLGGRGRCGARRGAARGPFTPDRDLIDAVTPDHPVFVNRFDRSMFLANSLRAEARRHHRDARRIRPAARSCKDASGRLTGILKGTAADLVRKVIPPIPFEQRLVQVRAVLKEAREGGVTTMQDLTSRRAAARVPGAAAPRRADGAHHAAADARQRRPHARRSGSRAASATTG